MDEDEVEHASDDGLDPEEDNIQRKCRRRKIDDDYVSKVDSDSDEEAPMDELEPEHISDEEDSNKKKNKESKGWSRKHRTEISDAKLEGDEQEETVFIDNLPNDEIQIKAMLT